MLEALDLVVRVLLCVFEDALTGNKDGVYQQVGSFAHKSVEVVYGLENDGDDWV